MGETSIMLGFLVEREIFEDDEAGVVKVLDSLEIPYVLHPCSDFDSSFPQKIKTPQVFCYGSLELIAQIQAANDPRLKTICTIDNFDCLNYYHHFRQFLFNQDFNTAPLGPFIDEIDQILKLHSGQVFMRPSTGFKNGSISGGVFDRRTFDEYISFFEEALDKDDVVIFAPVKHIDYEWRTIIHGKKCITGCQYRTFDIGTKKLGFDPTPDFPDRVRDKAEEITHAVNWSPDEMYVLDIVESEGRLSIMELNALSTSGWYDCNVDAIVQSIQEIFA